MKRTFISLILGIGIVAALAGCNHTEPAIQEVALRGLGKEVKSFVDQISEETGLFLYSSAGEKQYLIVNYAGVTAGKEAKVLEAVTAEVQARSLNLHVEEKGTDHVQDMRFGKLKIFELADSAEYESVHIFENGEETFFNNVGT